MFNLKLVEFKTCHNTNKLKNVCMTTITLAQQLAYIF